MKKQNRIKGSGSHNKTSDPIQLVKSASISVSK